MNRVCCFEFSATRRRETENGEAVRDDLLIVDLEPDLERFSCELRGSIGITGAPLEEGERGESFVDTGKGTGGACLGQRVLEGVSRPLDVPQGEDCLTEIVRQRVREAP